MGGIVIVEELAEPLQPSSLAVVHRQQRHCQPTSQLSQAVGRTVEDGEGYGIERNNAHHPQHLHAEVAELTGNRMGTGFVKIF